MKPHRLVAAGSILALMFAAVLVSGVAAQIHQVKEMNTEQIRALPRDQTVVLLPGGILEQHGPYLPSYTDGYQNESLTAQLAKAIVKRPGWHVLIFPVIPLGQGAANQIGDKHAFPGKGEKGQKRVRKGSVLDNEYSRVPPTPTTSSRAFLDPAHHW